MNQVYNKLFIVDCPVASQAHTFHHHTILPWQTKHAEDTKKEPSFEFQNLPYSRSRKIKSILQTMM